MLKLLTIVASALRDATRVDTLLGTTPALDDARAQRRGECNPHF